MSVDLHMKALQQGGGGRHVVELPQEEEIMRALVVHPPIGEAMVQVERPVMLLLLKLMR